MPGERHPQAHRMAAAPSLQSSIGGSVSRSRLSHERLDPSLPSAVNGLVRPPKKPWALPPVKSSLSSKRGPQGAGKEETKGLNVTRDRAVLSGPEDLVYAVSKALLIQQADPEGDSSWGIPNPKSYENLPVMMANAKDWVSFTILMTDLMFLWRKMQCGGLVDLLEAYKDSKLSLLAKKSRNDSLQAIYSLLKQHSRVLADDPNQLFHLAARSRDPSIKATLGHMQIKSQRLIDDWFAHFEANKLAAVANGLSDKGSRMDSVDKSSALRSRISLAPRLRVQLAKLRLKSRLTATEKLTDEEQGLLQECLRYLDALRKIFGIQQSGLAECLQSNTYHNLVSLVGTIVQAAESSRAKLKEKGLEAYADQMQSFLQGTNTAAPYKFLELAGLWTEVDTGAFINLSVYVPGKVWGDEKERFEFEKTLCKHVAGAARIDARLVDLVQVSLDPAEQARGTQAKALLRLMAHVTGLTLRVVSGKHWPVFMDANSKHNSNISVSVRLMALRKKLRTQGKSSQEMAMQVRMANFLTTLSQKTPLVTRSKPGKIDPVMPIFEDETFELFVYAPDQCLVITCYSFANGIQQNLGEVNIKVDDLISEALRCHEVVRSFGLVNHLNFKPVYFKNLSDKSRMRQAEITLSFQYFTRAAGCSPQKMVQRVCREAADMRSHLRAGCVVTGLAFQNDNTAWETLTIYVSAQSQTPEMKQERIVLLKYVFPALAIRCKTLKIHFKWIDLSHSGNVNADAIHRLEAINKSEISGYDDQGRSVRSTFALCLIGEKRGRVLNRKDVRGIVAANSDGVYDWVLKGIRRGMTDLEMEVKAALFHNQTGANKNEVIVCCRNPAFLSDQRFLNDVPKSIRARYMEAHGSSNHVKMSELKDSALLRAQRVVHYRPSFESFVPRFDSEDEDDDFEDKSRGTNDLSRTQTWAPSQGENVAEGNRRDLLKGLTSDSQKSCGAQEVFDGDVVVGGLHGFALSVFESVWNTITKRYSYYRSGSRVNPYDESIFKQTELINAYCTAQYLVPEGTQEKVLTMLEDLMEFSCLEYGDVVLLIGAHGSGKSTLLARLVQHSKVLKTERILNVPMVQRQFSRAVRRVIDARRMFSHTQKATSNSNEPEMERIGTEQWADIRYQIWKSGQNLEDRKQESEIMSMLPNSSEVNKRDHVKLGKILAGIKSLRETKTLESEIKFRLQQPRVHFFFKCAGDTTMHMLTHLCSSILGRDTTQVSWERFEDLLRLSCIPGYKHKDSPEKVKYQPALLVLDGLDEKERVEIRRIVLALQGRVRALMTVDEADIQDHDLSTYEGLRDTCSTIRIPELGHDERILMFDFLIAFGLNKNKPESFRTQIITERPAAGNALYLKTVVAYLQAANILRRNPDPATAISTETVDIIISHMIPMAEKRVGAQAVRWLFQILNFESRGLEYKDMRSTMQALASAESCEQISDGDLRLLVECFRPFADVKSNLIEDYLCITRSCMLEAANRYYNTQDQRAALHTAGDSLASMRRYAEQQDARLERFLREEQADEGRGAENWNWFSEEEDDEAVKDDGDEDIIDELMLDFGNREMKFDRELYLKWCNGDDNDDCNLTMNLYEMLKMLRSLNVFPQLVTKMQVLKAFDAANSPEREDRISTDTDVSQLDFYEFLDCLKHLHGLYSSLLRQEYDQSLEVAVIKVQAHHRGKKTRQETRRLLRERRTKMERCGMNLLRESDLSEHERELLVKLQANSRRNIQRADFQQKLMRRKIFMREHPRARHGTFASIKGRIRKDGVVAIFQQRLMHVFDCVQDAFVFIDADGNDLISQTEFMIGVRKLELNQECEEKDFSKLAAIVAGADAMIDCCEFMRAFSWHDLYNVDAAMHEAKIIKSSSIAKAKDRLAAFFIVQSARRRTRDGVAAGTTHSTDKVSVF